MGLLPHVSTYSAGAAEQSAVFVGALLGFLTSAALLAHAVACRGLARQLWRALASRLQWSDPAMREDVLKKIRAESLHHACCINLFVTVWCCVNCGMMIVHIASGAPRWMTVWQDAVWIWATFACIICQMALRHTPHHLTVDAVYVCFMVGQTLFVSVGPAEQVPFISAAGFSVLVRGLWSLACMRVPAVTVLTTFHFLSVCAGFARTQAPCAEDGGSQNLQVFVLCEFIGDAGIVLCTLVWRHFCRVRVLHEIQASISQSENEAARNLLNIVCDSTVELDGKLQVMDETPRLASLLQHGSDRSLRGSSMLQYVIKEDQGLFADRICSVSDECMANVFHVRMRDGINNVLTMEVFHVRVNRFLRASSHLIGLREYNDAAENVGQLRLPEAPEEGPKRSRRHGAPKASEAAPPKGSPSPADAEGACPPGHELGGPPSWESSSPTPSPSTSSLCGGDGEVAAWIELCSDCWTICSSTAGFALFWGSGSRNSRISPGARELLQWIKPDQKEDLIGWAQSSYQQLRGVVPFMGAASKGAKHSVHFRPPSLWQVKSRLAYVANITISLPKDERQHQAMIARLAFSDIRVLQQGRAPPTVQAL